MRHMAWLSTGESPVHTVLAHPIVQEMMACDMDLAGPIGRGRRQHDAHAWECVTLSALGFVLWLVLVH